MTDSGFGGRFVVPPQLRTSDVRLLDDICRGLDLIHNAPISSDRDANSLDAGVRDEAVSDVLIVVLAAATAIGHADQYLLTHLWRLAKATRVDAELRTELLDHGQAIIATAPGALRTWSGNTFIDTASTPRTGFVWTLAAVLVSAEYGGCETAPVLLLNAAAETERRFVEARLWSEARRGRGSG